MLFLPPPRNLTVKDYRPSCTIHSHTAKHPLSLQILLLKSVVLLEEKGSGPVKGIDVKPYDSRITQADLFAEMIHYCSRNHSI